MGHLLEADVIGEVGDHGHVAEGGAPGTGTVERGRQLAKRPGQVDAIRRRLDRHAAAASQPGRRRPSAIGLRATSGMEAMQATERLGLEPIDRPPDVDHVLTQRVCGEPVDGFTDKRIDRLLQTASRIRDGERFHAHILPNICSSPHGVYLNP